MGKNMTQKGAKNRRKKQPKITKTVFGSFHQYRNYNHHNVNLHIVFEYFFRPQTLMVWFFFSNTIHFTMLAQPKKIEFSKGGAQLQFPV
jgi:hypothetical protein